MLISLAIMMMNQKNNLIVLETLCLSQPTFDSPGRWKTCLVGVGWAKTQSVVPNGGDVWRVRNFVKAYHFTT